MSEGTLGDQTKYLNLTLALCPRALLPVKLARFIQVMSVAAGFRLFRICQKLIVQASFR